MAREKRRGPTRNGPGRDTPRARTVSRARTRSSATAKAGSTAPQRRGSEPVEPIATATAAAKGLGRAGLGITRRAVALIVVVAILLLSYATSLRVWYDQQSEIAATKADIRARQERIAELEEELARWDDPEYVKQQARERLGWVVPGETGYRVVGPDGKPLGGTGALNDDAEAAPPEEAAWWGRLFGSVQAVDQPAPAAEADPEPGEPTAPPTVGPTPEAKPTP